MAVEGAPGAPRTFVASTEQDREAPPKPFTLAGVYARGHVPDGSDGSWALDLMAMGAPPLGAIDTMRDAILVDERTGQQVYHPGAIMAFMRQVLEPDSAAMFHHLVEDRTRICKLETLAEIMLWLVEEYTGRRPTGAPSSSTTGGAQTGGGAPAGGPWPAGSFPPPPPPPQ